MSDRIDIFERAFSGGTSGCRRICECGKTFYHNDSREWGWEDGELETLRASDAIALGYAPGSVLIHGAEYCNACSCWHDKARKIMSWLIEYRRETSLFYELESNRLRELAESMPVIPS
jgi:hypothetical protein